MKKIKVNLGKRSYNIYIGFDILEKISNFFPKIVSKSPILVITNRKIRRYIGKNLASALKNDSYEVFIKEVPDSEKAKSFKVYNEIIKTVSEIGKKTKPLIAALGGGVVGDVSGFAASTYRRGVPYIQVPTTLIAACDSSIGGKVAIDLPQAKNIVGSFYQPSAVICDIGNLKTLPKKEIINGLAEIIKYGVIKDAKLFAYIEKNINKLLRLEKSPLEYVIFRCVSIKARIVEKDELDTKGLRAILNFGHTFGHAIESSFGYSKRYTHGEAVAIGMALACDTAVELRMLKRKDSDRIKKLISKAGLPARIKNANIARILKSISYDKKFLKGVNRFVLPIKIGRVKIVTGIPDTLIRRVLYNSAKKGAV